MRGYIGLQKDYKGLHRVTKGYIGLRRDYEGLATEDYG